MGLRVHGGIFNQHAPRQESYPSYRLLQVSKPISLRIINRHPPGPPNRHKPWVCSPPHACTFYGYTYTGFDLQVRGPFGLHLPGPFTLRVRGLHTCTYRGLLPDTCLDLNPPRPHPTPHDPTTVTPTPSPPTQPDPPTPTVEAKQLLVQMRILFRSFTKSSNKLRLWRRWSSNS